MSECPRTRTLLAEAEPSELRGLGASAVSAHVRTCPACARAAAVLLEETDALGAFLGAAAGGDASPDRVAAVLARAAVELPAPPRRAKPLRFGLRRVWWPVAAAAVAAGLLFVFKDRMPPPGTASLRVADAPPLVRAAPDQNVAVIQTDDPDITVLWFF